MASVNDLLILCGQYEKIGGISPPALTPGGRHATNLRLPGADGGDRDHKSQDNHQKTLGERVGPEAGAGPPRVPDVWKRDGRWVCCTGVGQQSPNTTIEDPTKIAKPASEQIDARRRMMRIVADTGHRTPDTVCSGVGVRLGDPGSAARTTIAEATTEFHGAVAVVKSAMAHGAAVRHGGYVDASSPSLTQQDGKFALMTEAEARRHFNTPA